MAKGIFVYVLLHQLYCIVLCIVLEHEYSVNDLLLLLYSVQCQRIESPKPETLSTNCDFSPNFCVIRSNWCTRHEEKNYPPDCTLFNPHLFIPQRHSINSEGLLCLNWSAAIRRSSQTITRGHVSKGCWWLGPGIYKSGPPSDKKRFALFVSNPGNN